MGAVQGFERLLYPSRRPKRALVRQFDDKALRLAAEIPPYYQTPVPLVLTGKLDLCRFDWQKRQRVGAIGDGVRFSPIDGQHPFCWLLTFGAGGTVPSLHFRH